MPPPVRLRSALSRRGTPTTLGRIVLSGLCRVNDQRDGLPHDVEEAPGEPPPPPVGCAPNRSGLEMDRLRNFEQWAREHAEAEDRERGEEHHRGREARSGGRDGVQPRWREAREHEPRV